MSDTVLVSLITTIPGFITVAGVVYVQVRTLQSSLKKLSEKHEVLREEQSQQASKVNGKLDALLEVTRAVAFRAGALDEREKSLAAGKKGIQ